MRVVAMFRVSTEKQASQGASLAAQERIYGELAAKNGWTTVAQFKGCESATQATLDRRVLQQVLACIRDTEPDALYVHEQSRLTRGDELEVAGLFRELRERQIKILVGGVVRDLDSIDERFMLGIQSLVDRAESDRIKERMARGRNQKARQGKKCSGPSPFGYSNPHPGQAARGTLQVVEAEAAVVRRAFDLAARGEGTRAIARDLNARGLASPTGVRWGKTTVANLLRNPAYMGTAAAGVWVAPKGTRKFRLNLSGASAILVEDAHAPIVDRDTWIAVNARAKVCSAPVPRMLSGLLWVEGLKYEGDRNKGQRIYRGPKGVTGKPSLDSAATDNAVWDAFASLATSEEFVEALMAEADRPHERMVAMQEIDHLNETIGRQRRRVDRFVEMRADGEIDKPTFHAKVQEANRAVAEMEAEVATLRAKAQMMDGSASVRVVKAVQALLGGRTKLTGEQKRSILRSIVRRIDVGAVSTGSRHNRDSAGRVLPGRNARWRIEKVSFALALPTAPGQEAGEGRRGQVATTSLAAGCSAEEGNVDRVGHLATTDSCSAPPALAKP